MTVAVTVLLVIIAVAVAAFAFSAMRTVGQSAERAIALDLPLPRRPRPLVTAFHVKGNTASTVFSVPLGDAAPGQHLIDLLCESAVEYVREKSEEGLPLEDVHRIEVSAMRGDVPELIGSVDLPEAGVLPEPDVKVLIEPTSDPIAAIATVIADTSVSARSGDTTTLEPVWEFVQLSGPTEAHLRAIAVDPGSMTLEDLVLGLLRVSGYDVHVGRAGFTIGSEEKAGIYGVSRGGQSTVLVILSHEQGAYPELDERVLSEFAVSVVQTNPDQAVLVTDKFSPYAMYEREKRDKRLVFITRERLQGFVDSFSLG
ncbi:MAG: hypothetical protein BMS9Abin20_0592 [Acidimicrobiia bacterium]|nr:MAG: hypothetical protein BMS9Abin20_0592 [Acidimicrobiia bacterium]